MSCKAALQGVQREVAGTNRTGGNEPVSTVVRGESHGCMSVFENVEGFRKVVGLDEMCWKSRGLSMILWSEEEGEEGGGAVGEEDLGHDLQKRLQVQGVDRMSLLGRGNSVKWETTWVVGGDVEGLQFDKRPSIGRSRCWLTEWSSLVGWWRSARSSDIYPRQDHADLHGLSGSEFGTSVSVLDARDAMVMSEGKHAFPDTGELSTSSDGDGAGVPSFEVATVSSFPDLSMCRAGGGLEEDQIRVALQSPDDRCGIGFSGDGAFLSGVRTSSGEGISSGARSFTDSRDGSSRDRHLPSGPGSGGDFGPKGRGGDGGVWIEGRGGEVFGLSGSVGSDGEIRGVGNGSDFDERCVIFVVEAPNFPLINLIVDLGDLLRRGKDPFPTSLPRLLEVSSNQGSKVMVRPAAKALISSVSESFDLSTRAEALEALEGSNTTRRNLGGNDGSCQATNPIDQCWRCRKDWAANRMRLADCVLAWCQDHLRRRMVNTMSSMTRRTLACRTQNRHTTTCSHPAGSPLIIFSKSMVIRLNQELIMTSDKTIDGRGVEVHIQGGAGFTLQFVKNIIIHGIYIHDIQQGPGGMIRDSMQHFGLRTNNDCDWVSIIGLRIFGSIISQRGIAMMGSLMP
ncbi:hypothetical protein Dimus_023916 [Dionaea muscipula]